MIFIASKEIFLVNVEVSIQFEAAILMFLAL